MVAVLYELRAKGKLSFTEEGEAAGRSRAPSGSEGAGGRMPITERKEERR